MILFCLEYAWVHKILEESAELQIVSLSCPFVFGLKSFSGDLRPHSHNLAEWEKVGIKLISSVVLGMGTIRDDSWTNMGI